MHPAAMTGAMTMKFSLDTGVIGAPGLRPLPLPIDGQAPPAGLDFHHIDAP